MADKSPTHEWVNTGIAALALIASATARRFAWQINQARNENAVVPGRLSRINSV